MNSENVTIVSPAQVDSVEFDSFMRTAYSSAKTDFLRDHGHWRHHGQENRFVLLKDDQLAGYSAIIPEPLHLLQNRVVSAAWLVDVYVHEDFRGQKLQRYLDARVKTSSEVLLGFPNHLAAKVHKKHGWGVRDDYHIMMLPLRPTEVSIVRQVHGLKGIAMRTAAWLARPLAWMYRYWVAHRKVDGAWIIEEPDADLLAAVFEKYSDGWITTNRDADFIRWRYLQAPCRSQLTFFGAGSSPQDLSIIAIVRALPRQPSATARILDIFGDLRDREALSNVLRLVIQQAAKQGAAQVTAMVTNSDLYSALRANHLVVRLSLRFCWISDDPAIMQTIAEGNSHWCYADSDADSID